MKFLKIRLADDKVYTFSTFSVLESTTLRNKFSQYEELEQEKEKIIFEIDEKGNFKKDDSGNLISKKLTQEDKTKLQELESKVIDFGADLLRKSLCKRHPEFKETEKIKENISKVLDLIDLNDFKKLVPFTMTGVYIQDEVTIIDISAEEPVEQKNVK